jgi:hypothetical protein
LEGKGTEIFTPKAEFQCQYSSSWRCTTKFRRKNGDIRSKAGRGVHDRLHRYPETEGLASLAFNETISQFCLLNPQEANNADLRANQILRTNYFVQRGFFSLEISLWNFSDQKQPDRSGQGMDHHHLKNL